MFVYDFGLVKGSGAFSIVGVKGEDTREIDRDLEFSYKFKGSRELK